MAQGLEVLQAALAGKRVRYRNSFGTWSGWYQFDLYTGLLRSTDHSWNGGMSAFWEFEWQIEEPTMTFTEAVAAMDAGQTVERGRVDARGNPELVRFRRNGDDYVFCMQIHAPGGFYEYCSKAHFTPDDIHATDWRIVTEEPKDERPTALEVAQVALQALYHVTPVGLAPREAARRLETRWPGAFRKEDA